MSHGGEASGTGANPDFNEAERLDPRNVHLLTPARGSTYSLFVVSPKRCESLIRFSILHRTTWISSVGKGGIAQAEGDLPRAAALLAPLHPAARR